MIAVALLLTAFSQDVPPTPEQATAFARELDTALSKGERIAFDIALDADAFYDRVIGTTRLADGVVRFIKPIIRMTFTSQYVFAVVPERVTYKFLRAKAGDGGVRVLFRMTGRAGALFYHELVLARTGGKIRVVDIFVVNYGEMLSATTRRVMLPTPARLRILNELKRPTPDDFLDDFQGKDINKLVQLKSAGESKKVLDFYKEHVLSLKPLRTAHILRIAAARDVGDSAHEEAIREMLESFPSEPAADMAAVPGFIQYKKLDKALEALERLEKAVGGDVYLNSLRASAHMASGDANKARTLAATVTEQEPMLDQGWWTLIQVHLALKDFKEVARCLSLVEKHLETTLGDFSTNKIYEEFIKSQEYADWMKGRK